MTRDYSKFTLPGSTPTPPRPQASPLTQLGWQAFFAQQIDADVLRATPPARVTEVHRSGLRVIGNDLDTMVPPRADATVGDWLLYDPHHPEHSKLLGRKSVIKRRAPGTDRQIQWIAANIDTAFIVTSCNDDFNVARLERYIALAFEAQIDPVILLTKADMTDDADAYVQQAQALSDAVPVVALDARGDTPRTALATWCKPGQTVAFLGSSGVGKSTLTNALIGSDAIATQAIREDDARGRHTTTRRQLHVVPDGCIVLDTPGMREVQMTDAADGIGTLFADLDALAQQCKFRDCQHQSEPGCAVLAARDHGQLDEARLKRWHKLMAEDAFNSASLAERRSRDRAFGKMVRNAVSAKDTSRR